MTDAFIDQHADALVAFCQELVRRPSPNPPGDTRAVAEHVEATLAAHGIAVEAVQDQPTTPNLVATVEGARPGRHLVLNGHMDVYPAGDESAWTSPPWSGDVVDGRLRGRGAGDMKSGLATLVFAFLALAADRTWPGRVSLLAVSDEMSFSPHGAPLVLERRPDLVGDAAIGAEPTSPDFVLLGEKGMLWVELETRGDSGAGAYAVGLANAIETMAAVVRDLAAYRDIPAVLAPDVVRALAEGGGTAGLPPEALTYADDRVLPLPTVNVGRFEGGAKINLVAERCRAEVDIRMPPGVPLARAVAFLDEVVARHPGTSYRVIQAMEANWTAPDAELLRALLDEGERVRGVRPRLELGITASDTRLWRARGVPAAMIGPRIHGQGQPDESIAVSDLLDCARIIAGAARRYLDGA